MMPVKRQLQYNLSLRDCEGLNESNQKRDSYMEDITEVEIIGLTGELDVWSQREEEP